MDSKKKILYVCAEVSPYVAENKYTGLFTELLQAMHDRGNEIRTFMPRYGTINERRNQLHEVIRLSGMNLIIDDTDHQLVIKVASIPQSRVQIYFIDNEDFFSRKSILRDENGEEFEDNDERAIFFARGVLETVKKLRWEPNVIHCHGWFSGFVAAYLRYAFADDPIFANVKVVVSLDGDRFDKNLNKTVVDKLRSEGIDGEELSLLSDSTYENLCRFVCNYADGIVISSDDVDESIIEIARQSGKPLYEFEEVREGEYYDKYLNFYDTI